MTDYFHDNSAYYSEHPIKDPHAKPDFVPITECYHKACRTKAQEAIVMNGGVITPYCKKHRKTTSTFIDGLNLRYAGKTEYEVIAWNRSVEAAYNGQRKTGKPGWKNAGATQDGKSGGVQKTGDSPSE